MSENREGLQETSVDWSREDIERIWDVFFARGLMLDRKSLYYDEGADSDFCEMHRRHLAETLDMAGLRRSWSEWRDD